MAVVVSRRLLSSGPVLKKLEENINLLPTYQSILVRTPPSMWVAWHRHPLPLTQIGAHHVSQAKEQAKATEIESKEATSAVTASPFGARKKAGAMAAAAMLRTQAFVKQASKKRGKQQLMRQKLCQLDAFLELLLEV